MFSGSDLFGFIGPFVYRELPGRLESNGVNQAYLENSQLDVLAMGRDYGRYLQGILKEQVY
jgi:hypothetical protein